MRLSTRFLAFVFVAGATLANSFSCPAQEYPRKEFNPEKLADEIFPFQSLDINYQELYENLLQLLASPIDLNNASMEEIRSLFVLREVQVEALLNYRKENGPFRLRTPDPS
jgi:Helix-hairpin-helix motif